MIYSACGPSLDNAFLNRLKRIDTRLDMKWNEGVKRWVMIYDKGNHHYVNMFLIETEDQEYRHPDQRDLVRIRAADLCAKDAVSRFRDAREYMVETRERDRQNTKDTFRNLTKDNKVQLMQAFTKLANVGKGNSAFRRIQAKARGEVY